MTAPGEIIVADSDGLETILAKLRASTAPSVIIGRDLFIYLLSKAMGV
jgi:hypothetical protein